MLVERNIVIDGKHGRPIVLDLAHNGSSDPKPIIVFLHGFKGFKDWGHFNKVMEYFVDHGFAYLKFNFSHNGGTIEQPVDFPDLEAFGNNNYSKELGDLETVLDWVGERSELCLDKERIYLIGHSRGGGIGTIAASEDSRIKKIVTWASVSDLINRFSSEQIAQWEKEGVFYIENSRTKQQMPLYYQLVEDTLNNKDRFDIKLAAGKLNIPHLIIHGSEDPTVSVEEAKRINEWNPSSSLFIVDGADHTFGSSHPYNYDGFTSHMEIVLNETLMFFLEVPLFL